MKLNVSIIIAAYNIEEYIARCINSITNQTLQNIEIIVVNDGSNDNTLNEIRNLAFNDKRIKIIDKKNEGSMEARKSGMEIANGKYILFVDGDDWLELNALELLYNNAENNNSDIVIYNAYRSDDNKKIKLDIFKRDLNKDCIKNLFLENIYPCIWSKFLKLDYIKKNNIEFVSDISYAEDVATSASLFMYNPTISYVNKYLYNYYQRNNSITNTINNKVLEISDAMNFINRKLKENNLYDKYKEEYEYMIYNHIMEYQLLNKYYNYEELGKYIQKIYKSNNIDINKNKYIKERISTYPLSQKLRTKAYCKSYDLGRLYDNIRSIKKG